VPPDVSRQVRRAAVALVAASAVVLIPHRLIAHGLIAPGGRPVAAPVVLRGLVLAFDLAVLAVALGLLRRGSAVVKWAGQSPARLGRLAGHHRTVAAATLAGIVAVIALDARGYSYSSRRLASGAAGSLAVAALAWGVYRGLVRVVNERAWRWIQRGQAIAGRGVDPEASGMPDDLAGRLRRLSAYFAIGVALVLASWVWDLDLALFRFVSGQPLWGLAGKDPGARVFVTVGDLAQAVAFLVACAAAWRYMSTFFALAVFPRMPDDPGVRFAVVTLCRYAVLGLGLICVLSSVHLGLEKIGVVLAALGVGLGFGLQEIVSNFVCGIILLLERPIRVGDVVTVSNMTGKIDRINIRATTITNGDNQSMIVPNRAFITGDLVNWTLKDKVIRVTVRVKVAHGTDPDRVSELLLSIARDDADVLRNPVPAALMEEITDTALLFVLFVHVPEPSLAGRVRHRLFRQIQKHFDEQGIRIPLPTQELRFSSRDSDLARPFTHPGEHRRVDNPAATPPVPFLSAPRSTPAPLESCHRGVDE